MRNLAILIGGLLLAWPAGAAEKVLAMFPADAQPLVTQIQVEPPQWTIGVDTAEKAEGLAAVSLEHKSDSTDSAWPFETAITVPGNCVLWYEATMRTQGANLKAYPEMIVCFPDGKEYFSRGLSQPFLNTQGWRRCRIPFYLDAGEKTLTVRMGVRCEGQGTVHLDAVRLVERPRTWWSDENTLGGVLGAIGGLFGSVVGLWGGLVGFLVPRGKGRPFVIASGIAFLGLGIVSLMLGFGFLLSGSGRALYYPFLLAGGITTTVLAVLLPGIVRRYRVTEAQRLTALEHADTL